MTGYLRCSLPLMILAAWTAAAQTPSRVDRNVVYGMFSGLALLMDVHYPERPNGQGILCIPGSGWNAPLGYDAAPLKEGAELEDWAAGLRGAGYVLFFANHRASPRFEYPAAVEDTQRAVRFIRANAAKFGIRPDRIGAFGASSGGHLVSLLGVLDGTGDPEDPDPVNRLSSRVQAVVALYAPSDLKGVLTPRGVAAVALFVGARNMLTDSTPHGAPEFRRYAAASPITHVTRDDPPFLLFHGDADLTVPFEQSQLMDGALRKAGVAVKFVPVTGGAHGRNFGLKAGDPRLSEYYSTAVRWFDGYLRGDSR
jgi:acetyl esterase/lipase